MTHPNEYTSELLLMFPLEGIAVSELPLFAVEYIAVSDNL